MFDMNIEDDDTPEDIRLRRDDLYEGVKKLAEGTFVWIGFKGPDILVNNQERIFCEIAVIDEGYYIYCIYSEWAKETNYFCEVNNAGSCSYYVETIDECIGEMQRLIIFEENRSKKPIPKPVNIKDYGNDSKAFCLNANDWFTEKKQEGKIQYILSTRGISKQSIVTPGLCMLHRYVGISAADIPDPVTFFYQIEIKTVHGKGTAVFKLVCHQTPTMTERVKNFFKDIILPKMGKLFREDGTWYDMRLGSFNLDADTDGTDIYAFLDKSLIAGEHFEDKILKSINVDR